MADVQLEIFNLVVAMYFFFVLKAHPYLVANGIGSGPAGYIAPTALASHPSAQAQMGTIQVP